ncbi:hypothetical protein T06_16004 [Trichinella sp. T6]|nr:hypothetical protein T09_7543 [Trichinella sp. T9]KRX82324.1 hypothetical protein T06_16004 [Trichinella sp. T6]
MAFDRYFMSDAEYKQFTFTYQIKPLYSTLCLPPKICILMKFYTMRRCSIRATVAALLLHKGTRHVVNYNSLLQYCLRISGNIKFHLPADVYLFIPNKLRPNNRRGLESQCCCPNDQKWYDNHQ